MKDWGWDEHELVQRCKEGSEAAYAELVRQHRPRLFTLAYRLTSDRETAEDVVQETFLAAFRAIEGFEPRPSLSAWLNKIAIRLAGKAAARRRQRATTSLFPSLDDEQLERGILEPADARQDPMLAAEMAELHREVAHAISALPFKMRTAVVLRHVLGLDYADAAKVMAVPLNTYKSHLLRGTRQLREVLADSLVEQVTPDRPNGRRRRAITVETTAGAGDASGRDQGVFDLPSPARLFSDEELIRH